MKKMIGKMRTIDGIYGEVSYGSIVKDKPDSGCSTNVHVRDEDGIDVEKYELEGLPDDLEWMDMDTYFKMALIKSIKSTKNSIHKIGNTLEEIKNEIVKMNKIKIECCSPKTNDEFTNKEIQV